MGNRRRKSPQEKQRTLEESKTLGMVEIARIYEISYQALKNWQDIYAISGLDGLAAVRFTPFLGQNFSRFKVFSRLNDIFSAAHPPGHVRGR